MGKVWRRATLAQPPPELRNCKGRARYPIHPLLNSELRWPRPLATNSHSHFIVGFLRALAIHFSNVHWSITATFCRRGLSFSFVSTVYFSMEIFDCIYMYGLLYSGVLYLTRVRIIFSISQFLPWGRSLRARSEIPGVDG